MPQPSVHEKIEQCVRYVADALSYEQEVDSIRKELLSRGLGEVVAYHVFAAGVILHNHRKEPRAS